MSDIPKIGAHSPAAVIRDVTEVLPKLRTLVAVGIFSDGSASVWMSDTPDEIERASIVLLRHATEVQGASD
jgi:hypothetical protein